MINRPSRKELFNAIQRAKDAVAAGRIEIVDAVSFAADAIELGYDIESELAGLLETLFNRMSPDHYTGSRPPQKSYERVIQNLELFAFVAEAEVLGENVYLKFALADGAIWLVSLHKDRPLKKGDEK